MFSVEIDAATCHKRTSVHQKGFARLLMGHRRPCLRPLRVASGRPPLRLINYFAAQKSVKDYSCYPELRAYCGKVAFEDVRRRSQGGIDMPPVPTACEPIADEISGLKAQDTQLLSQLSTLTGLRLGPCLPKSSQVARR